MKKHTLIYDCDPGIDDAVAMLIMFANQNVFNTLGVTTVGGNTTLDHTSQNALNICSMLGQNTPVFAGCPEPTINQPLFGDIAHSHNGLGGVQLPKSPNSLPTQHAVDFIVQTVSNSDIPVTLFTSGPMTNVACALTLKPEIKENIKEIISMGGAIGVGNITPAAEYNFFFDPHAVRKIIDSGCKLTIMPLDMTHTALVPEGCIKSLISSNNQIRQLYGKMMWEHYQYDKRIFELNGCAVHDPTIFAYVLAPELFTSRDVYVAIDIAPGPSQGRTNIDWFGILNKPANATVVDSIKVDGLIDLIEQSFNYFEGL